MDLHTKNSRRLSNWINTGSLLFMIAVAFVDKGGRDVSTV